MAERVDIRGGAGEFEAAVIAVVLDEIARQERRGAEGRPVASSLMPAWIRALSPRDEPNMPREAVWPD